MSRAIQIKHTSEILGVELKVTDEDMRQSIEEIVNGLDVISSRTIHRPKFTSDLVYEFRHCVDTGYKDGGNYDKINYIYFDYHTEHNTLYYTEFFEFRLRNEGYKFTYGKLHIILNEVFSKYFKRRIGVIRPYQRGSKFPVC